MSTPAITPAERMVSVLARELSDGWTAVVGARSNIPLAACQLAQATHAPRLTVIAGAVFVNPRRLTPHFAAGLDCVAESVGDFVDVYQLTEAGVDVMFYSGLQIDRFGNINVHWVDRPDGRLRGPGLANTTFGHSAGRILLWAERHEARTLVPQVDFVSVTGHNYRGRSRAECGLGNLGPARLVTPMMTFRAENDALVPDTLHDGADWADVRARTGWELPDEAPPPTADPTGEELEILRGQIDPSGLLRGGRA